MSNPNPINVTASVNARLKNVAREHNINFRFILIRYAIERFLYRLSISEYTKQFVLKGGNLFIIWQDGFSYRPTIDSDFLCFGNNDEMHLKAIFDKICNIAECENDGMKYDASSITINLIREENEYGGTRVKLNAYLGSARIPLQFDIGIGDSITPAPEMGSFPVLLDGEIPKLKIYPKSTVIAEKVETMVFKGMNNSRMKDFYDVWLLAELFDHDYNTLRKAIENTFNRRGTEIPGECPLCFTEEFINPQKVVQWNAFIRKNTLDNSPDSFATAIMGIRNFVMPIIMPDGKRFVLWQAGKGWQ